MIDADREYKLDLFLYKGVWYCDMLGPPGDPSKIVDEENWGWGDPGHIWAGHSASTPDEAATGCIRLAMERMREKEEKKATKAHQEH